MTGASTPAARRVWALRIGLLLTTLVLLAGLVEGAARVAYAYKDRLRAWLPTPQLQEYHVIDPDVPGHWRLQPGFVRSVSEALAAKDASGRAIGAGQLREGLDRQDLAADDIFIRINADGFRGPEIDPGHARPRVLTIGDSCTFGTIEGHTYTRALQRVLGEQGVNVEAINGGVEGYAPRNVLYRLDEYRALRPEVVTVYIGWNAMYDESATFGSVITPTLYSARLFQVALNAWRRIWYGDRAAALAAYRRDVRVDPDDPLLDRVRGHVPVFVGEVEAIVEGFRAGGSQVFLVTLPGLFTTGAPPSEAALRMGDYLPIYTTNPLVFARLTENYNDALRALAAREGVGLIDLAAWSVTALQPREQYFFDTIHLGEAGQELVGRVMARHLAGHVDW